MVAPRPAPAAVPSRYGSASGLRNAPWKAAPQPASMAPTSAPSTTRGSRSSKTIASSAWDSVEPTWTSGRCEAAARRMAPTPMCTGPTSTPSTAAPTRNADAATSQSARGRGEGSRAPPTRAAPAAASAVPVTSTANAGLQRRGDGADEVHDAGSPAGCDRVVEEHDRAVANRAGPVPARPGSDGRLRLPTALRVCEDDQAGVRGDHVLAGELGEAGAGGVGGIGDVPQAEEPVHRADERRRGR